MSLIDSPILVGGVGGSGTRVVTEILMEMGVFMGKNLNLSKDYIEYGLAKTLRELKSNGEGKSADDAIKYIHKRLDKIEKSIKSDMKSQCHYLGWGWKVPGNFYLLEHANEHFPNVRYVHVMRHGLDMAFSQNQNQLHNWGFYFDIDSNNIPLHIASLRYWVEANKFAKALGLKVLKDRFHVLRFDDLVTKPKRTIEELSTFLKMECIDVDKLIDIVHIPDSFERYKEKDISIFSKADIKEVIDFGFNI